MMLRDGPKIGKYLNDMLSCIQDNQQLVSIWNRLLIDEFLYAHSLKVCKLATQLALVYNLKDSAIMDISLAGVFHDIGKLNVPKEMLYKSGRLSEEENKIVMRHPVDGCEMLCGVVNDKVLDLVLHHHDMSKRTELQDIIFTANVYSHLVGYQICHHAFDIVNVFDNLDRDMFEMLQSVVDD